MNTLRTTESAAQGKFLLCLLRFICATIIAIVLVIESSPAAIAQSVPWQQIDFSTGIAGTYSYASGSPPTYTIGGAGTGIGFTSDSLTFVYTTACGNTEMEAKVVSQSSSSATAMSGLMMRDYLGGSCFSANNRHRSILVRIQRHHK